MKRIVLLFLTFVMFFNLSAYATQSDMSPWARGEVEKAISLGFVPSEMQSEYQENITRAEFAKIAVIFVARHFDMEVDEVVEWFLANKTENGQPISFKQGIFTDIDHSEHKYYIECANTMRIVNGREDGIFDPDACITREEAATMLLRVYFCYGGGVKIGPKSEGVDAFADKNEISPWADSAVRYMYQWDVMKGVSAKQYAPKMYYTKEQCYVTFVRLADVYSYR